MAKKAPTGAEDFFEFQQTQQDARITRCWLCQNESARRCVNEIMSEAKRLGRDVELVQLAAYLKQHFGFPRDPRTVRRHLDKHEFRLERARG